MRILVFCDNPDCTAVTFAEQVSDLTARYARRTALLRRAVTSIALALAGRPAGGRPGHDAPDPPLPILDPQPPQPDPQPLELPETRLAARTRERYAAVQSLLRERQSAPSPANYA